MARGRVHVIGGPGAGKTTVARRLAVRLGVPHFDLDRVAAYRPPPGVSKDTPFGKWERVPWDRRVDAARELAEREAWVTEGVYAGWTEPLVSAADAIIWLDTPGWLAAMRVVRRQCRRIVGLDGGRYGLRALVFLLRRTGAGYKRGPVASEEALRQRDSANSSATIAAFLASHGDKVRRCTSRHDVDRAVEEIVGLLGR